MYKQKMISYGHPNIYSKLPGGIRREGRTASCILVFGHAGRNGGKNKHGHRLGRTLGIPTVNLTFPPHVLAPRRGVYITRVYLPDGTSLAGVTNVGTRPTVSDGTAVSVETFLLDFDGDLYGKCIRVEFCCRLRDEQKFDSLEALKAQIRENIRQTRDYFAAESTRG